LTFDATKFLNIDETKSVTERRPEPGTFGGTERQAKRTTERYSEPSTEFLIFDATESVEERRPEY